MVAQHGTSMVHILNPPTDVDVDGDGDEKQSPGISCNSPLPIAAKSLVAIRLHYCIRNNSKLSPVHGMWPHGKPQSSMACGRMVVESLWLQWPVAAGFEKRVPA